jgi:hypothetical protein
MERRTGSATMSPDLQQLARAEAMRCEAADRTELLLAIQSNTEAVKRQTESTERYAELVLAMPYGLTH